MIDKPQVIKYLRERHLSDGGYFFARVVPSSGLDTMLAVKTLKMLGDKKIPVKSINSFWMKEEKTEEFYQINHLFFAVETFREIGLEIKPFLKYRPFVEMLWKNQERTCKVKKGKSVSRADRRGGIIELDDLETSKDEHFIESMDYYYALGKGLESLHDLVSVSLDLNVEIDRKRVVEYILSLQNKDGGFGTERESNPQTTYDALSILNLLNYKLLKDKKRPIISYLIKSWKSKNYLEEVFFIFKSLNMLGGAEVITEETLNFAEMCQRGNGGFTRSTGLGITTIQDTYYGVSIFKRAGLI